MRRRAFLGAGAAVATGSVGAYALFDQGRDDTERPPAAARPPTLGETAVWGAFADNEPWPDCSAHFTLERRLGRRLPCMSWFVDWAHDFPEDAARSAKAGGYELLIAWMPIRWAGRPVSFRSIVRGDHDRYVLSFLRAARRYGRPVTIRFAHEMNLDGHRWSVGAGGLGSPAEFVAAWRHLYRLHRSVSSTNTQLLWCISNSEGRYPAEAFFPGREFVEKVGFDGYSGFTDTGWTAPKDMIGPAYRRLRRLAPDAPVWLCETGCRETGLRAGDRHSKARWLESLFAVTGFPALSHVVFFSKRKEQDWRLDSSPEALAAVRRGLDPRMHEGPEA